MRTAKGMICHVPPDEPENAHVNEVSIDAVVTHLLDHPGDEKLTPRDPCPKQTRSERTRRGRSELLRPLVSLLRGRLT